MEAKGSVIDEPTIETLMRWSDEGGCEAIDGCWLSLDERTCPHGQPSWAVVLGLASDLGDE
jgi:hypothetical protein